MKRIILLLVFAIIGVAVNAQHDCTDTNHEGNFDGLFCPGPPPPPEPPTEPSQTCYEIWTPYGWIVIFCEENEQ